MYTGGHVVVGNHYCLGPKIGEGSFGVIHQGVDMMTNTYVAIKLEPVKTSDPQLRDEYRVYRHLAGCHGVPEVHYYGTEGDYNVLCIDLLGPSLEQLFEACGRRFSIKTVAMLARQMITRIRSLHKRNMIYRDIKPDNYLTGLPDTPGESTVFLIDFGLAKRYFDPKTGKHIPYVDKKHVTGTARYMSVQTHLGSEQSRRDDLESLGFVFMYFLRGKLPWQGMNAKTNGHRNELIGQKKIATSIEDLCAGFPPEFAEYMHYVRNLTFEEEPRYEYLLSLFANVLTKMGQPEDFLFDWMLGNGALNVAKVIPPAAQYLTASNRANHATVNVASKPPTPNGLARSRTPTPNNNTRISSNLTFTAPSPVPLQPQPAVVSVSGLAQLPAVNNNNNGIGRMIGIRRSNPVLAPKPSEYVYGGTAAAAVGVSGSNNHASGNNLSTTGGGGTDSSGNWRRSTGRKRSPRNSTFTLDRTSRAVVASSQEMVHRAGDDPGSFAGIFDMELEPAANPSTVPATGSSGVSGERYR